MAHVIKPNKKLKQAQLNFGGSKTKPKLRIQFKNKTPEPESEEVAIVNDIVFNSISHSGDAATCRKTLTSGEENIQCPEVSTSTLNSETEKPTGTDVIVIDDSSCDGDMSKLSTEMSRNIDEVINVVIARGLSNQHEMIENRDVSRENKKRRRSKSPNPTSNLEILEHGQNADKTVDCDITGQLHSNVPLIIVSSPRSSEHLSKKPRCSIIDIMAKKPCQSKQNSKENSAKITELAEGGTTMKRKRQRSGSPKNSPTKLEPVLETENSVNNNLHKDDAVITHCEKTDLTVAENKVEEIDEKPEELMLSMTDTSNIEMDTTCEDMDTSGVDLSSNETSPNNKNTSPASKKVKRVRKVNATVQKRIEEKAKEREEKKKQKEFREKEKLEAKKKREEERIFKEEEKRKKKEEEEKLKQEKLRLKQEEMERKKMEQEAKRLEREQKEEEKKKEREKREVEKKLKEEAKLKLIQEKEKAEEEKKKKEMKRASNFMGFFTSPARANAPKKPPQQKQVGSFVPFQVKTGMSIAPIQRRNVSESSRSLLLEQIKQQNSSSNYLQEINSEVFQPRKSCSTIAKHSKQLLSLTDDGLELVGSGEDSRTSCVLQVRAKLLQFCENNRPPYYGTYRKTSKYIQPRNPLKKDTNLLDYEVDSDDEWEDPGEGEDIVNSDGEEEGDKEDEEEEGDGFFVPHGYLSDDEGIDEDADEETGGDISDQKLKMKQKEFENSFKRKLQVLTVKKIGCVWECDQHKCQPQDLDLLKGYKIKCFTTSPINLDELPPSKPLNTTSNNDQPKAPKNGVPEEAMPDLIRLLHGSPHSSQRLVKEFQVYWEYKNTIGCAPNHGPLPLNTLDTRVSGSNITQEESQKFLPPSNASSPSLPKPSLVIQSPSSQKISASPSQSRVAGVDLLSQMDKGPFWISKSQLTKKIKEIGAYGRKETLNRSCWFVLDATFEKYSLDPKNYPLPARWGYITQVPDIYLGEIPVAPTTPNSSSNNQENPQMKIGKFAHKVSAEDLLEKSILKCMQEKAKQESQPEPSTSLHKFTTKVSADELLEISRQKSMLEQESKKSRRVELTTLALKSQDEENVDPDSSSQPPPSFGVPSHSAFKSFFKMSDSVPEAKKSALLPNKTEDTKPVTNVDSV